MIADIQTEHHSFGSLDRPPYLIAEIGLNHSGQLDLARRMVDAARESGAQAAKFQLYRSRAFINPEARLSPDAAPGSLADFFAQFELRPEDWHALAKHTREQGLDFFCSVFDAPSLELYRELDARLIKIASCDIDNRMLFEDIKAHDPGRGPDDRAADDGANSTSASSDANSRPAWAVLFSSGTADQGEVERAVSYLEAERPRGIFECVSAYPADAADYNLAVIERWREGFACPIGISDHTTGNALSIAAVALGARMIERHFTLDRELPGPDQALSLNPADFANMSAAVLDVFAARGGRAKAPSSAEEAPRKFGRRSIYAARAIPAGASIAREDLIASRPGGAEGAISPADCDGIIGRTAAAEIAENEIIRAAKLDANPTAGEGRDGANPGDVSRRGDAR
ncbi:MAG: N-acetylneuraminate synthase family protein [bacterium]|nr:N-acetylneuraminate synthase family protein [bacterium]